MKVSSKHMCIACNYCRIRMVSEDHMLTAFLSQPSFISSGRSRMRCSSQIPLSDKPSATRPASSDISCKLLPCPDVLVWTWTESEHHKEAYKPRRLSTLTLQALIESRTDCSDDSSPEGRCRPCQINGMRSLQLESLNENRLMVLLA